MTSAWAWTAFGLAWFGRAGALLRCRDLGMVPRGPSVAGWIWGARAPLYSIVEICHEAWQGASASNQARGSRYGTFSRYLGRNDGSYWCGCDSSLRSECRIAESRTKRQSKGPDRNTQGDCKVTLPMGVCSSLDGWLLILSSSNDAGSSFRWLDWLTMGGLGKTPRSS